MDTRLNIILLSMIQEYTNTSAQDYSAEKLVEKYRTKIYELFDKELEDAIKAKFGPKNE